MKEKILEEIMKILRVKANDPIDLGLVVEMMISLPEALEKIIDMRWSKEKIYSSTVMCMIDSILVSLCTLNASEEELKHLEKVLGQPLRPFKKFEKKGIAA